MVSSWDFAVARLVEIIIVTHLLDQWHSKGVSLANATDLNQNVDHCRLDTVNWITQSSKNKFYKLTFNHMICNYNDHYHDFNITFSITGFSTKRLCMYHVRKIFA